MEIFLKGSNLLDPLAKTNGKRQPLFHVKKSKLGSEYSRTEMVWNQQVPYYYRRLLSSTSERGLGGGLIALCQGS